MPDLFGAPVGIMAVDQDQRDAAQSMMTLAQGAQKLQLGEMELSKQRNLMQALAQKGLIGNQSGGASGLQGATQHDLASDMFSFAGAALSTGNWEEADKAANTASTLLKNTSEIQKATFDSNIKRLNVMGNLMDGVYDQATWNRANAEYQAEVGEPSPYAKYPFNPDLVTKIKSGVTSAKDKAYIANEQSTTRLHDAETRKQAYEIRKISAETKKISDQDALLTKNGGKPPTNNELEPITDMIGSDYGKAITPDARRTLARPIYSRAQEIMEKDGKNRSEAIQQAYEESKSSGGLKNLNPAKKPSNQATDLVDRILQRLNADKGRVNAGLTGVGGFSRRIKEDIQNHLPYSLGGNDETSANDFEDDIAALEAIAPKAILDMKGASNKDSREMIKTIARARRLGASNQNTASAMNEVYRFMTGSDSPNFQGKKFGSDQGAKKTSTDGTKFAVGQVYRNPKGQTAKYLGDGKWEEM